MYFKYVQTYSILKCGIVYEYSICYCFSHKLPPSDVFSYFIIPSAKHCKKVLSQQTSDLCEKRLGYCCRSGKNNITQPVCASTINGFGKIFDNPCSLFYIRCMYPEVCFLKRSKSHPHCRLGKNNEQAIEF